MCKKSSEWITLTFFNKARCNLFCSQKVWEHISNNFILKQVEENIVKREKVVLGESWKLTKWLRKLYGIEMLFCSQLKHTY